MEHNRKHTTHIIVMYVLIVLLAAALAFMATRVRHVAAEDPGQWVCAQAACSQYVDPQAWVQEYCAPTSQNGTEFIACSVNLEGTEATIPLELINLSFVAQQCEVVTCVQEINVRAVNYTVSLDAVRQ